MGLDMFLKASRYLSSYNDTDKLTAERISLNFPELDFFRESEEQPSMTVSVEVGYWRKANAIHHWFVQNVQNGTDDCRTYHVSVSQLETLRDSCKEVLENNGLASEILPRASGFFFGSQEYDEWYFMQLEETIRIIDRALAMPDAWDFQYYSSW